MASNSVLLDDIQYGFTGGEISPLLIGRGDLDKYDLGLALARNFFIDHRGGLSSCPGTIFVDFVMEDDKPTKYFPFKFAPALESTYVMLFGHHYIRFVQDGAYVLEPGKDITDVSAAAAGVVTSVAHDFSDGDWIKIYDLEAPLELNQQTFVVTNSTTDTFELYNTFGEAVDTSALSAYTTGGHVYRIYTVATDYDAYDLRVLRGHQSRSQITLTHPEYKPRALIRTSDTDWAIADIEFGNSLPVPTTLAITSSTAGTAGVGFTVTSVDADGQESLPAQYTFSTTVANIVTAEGTSIKFSWTPTAGTVHYRIYRTQVTPVGTDISRSQPLGFVGISFGPEFIDNNIVPDFAQTPPMYQNPFADGAIQYIEVTDGGSGYTRLSVVSASVGTGFVGQAIVNESGVLLAIAIIKGGEGYTTATVISVTIGSGASVSVELTPATGNNPAVSTVFQQRQVFAATTNNPLTIWASKPRKFSLFDTSLITAANDAYSFELESEEVAPIRHLLPSRQGLVLLSQALISQLSASDGIVRATDAVADPQTYVGSSLVPPLVVDVDVIYIEGKGQTVRLLTYSDYQKLFLAQNLSVLSSHLLTSTKPVLSWTYASDPFKLIHAVRADGAMLLMTLDKEQNVFAWTQRWTKGLYVDVLSLQEDETDTVYVMTQRLINGRWTKMIEQIASREFAAVEEAWCVDCGLANTVNMPDASIDASAASGEDVIFTASAAIFTADDVGAYLRVGGGMAIITAFTDDTHLVGAIMQEITDVVPEDPDKRPIGADPGGWSLDHAITSFAGLRHLEGEFVSILADGSVLPQQQVIDGRITIKTGATRVIVGLPYKCVAKALPPSSTEQVIEDKRKRAVRTAVRLNESRGLKIGASLDHLQEMKDRTDEAYGIATLARTGMRVQLIDDGFNLDTEVYYVQDYPLPATILGWVNKLELGEESGE